MERERVQAENEGAELIRGKGPPAQSKVHAPKKGKAHLGRLRDLETRGGGGRGPAEARSTRTGIDNNVTSERHGAWIGE